MGRKLERYAHDRRDRRNGRYAKSSSCDGCGLPVGTNYCTDDEVCGGGDGPGFYLCERERCIAGRKGTVEERRVLYTAVRERTERAKHLIAAAREVKASPSMRGIKKCLEQAEQVARPLLEQADREALALLESRARAVLRKNPRLDEFIMAMGSAFFTVKDSIEHVYLMAGEPGYRAYTRPVAEVLEEFDDALKLTGTPLRFTADGPTVTDW